MKHLARLALLLALFVCAPRLGFARSSAPSQGPIGATRAPELDPAAWKLYTSAAGDYSAVFPGTPVEGTRPVPSAAQNVLMHTATVTTAAEYGVSYADFPSAVEGTDRAAAFLASVRDTGVKGIDGRLVEDRDEPFEGHPGRVYKVEFGGGYVLTCRSVVVKNRLYVVAATSYGEKKAPPGVVRIYAGAAEKFLNSFRLTTEGTGGRQADDEPPAPVQANAEDEVTRVKKQLEAAGEPVFGVCAVDKPCDSIKGKIINGRVIKGDVVLPKAVNRPQPPYPAIARAARASGTVVVQVIVDESGKVIAAHAISGNALLHVAAERAARDWEFTPTLIDGRPVKVIGTISFNFVLQ